MGLTDWTSKLFKKQLILLILKLVFVQTAKILMHIPCVISVVFQTVAL